MNKRSSELILNEKIKKTCMLKSDSTSSTNQTVDSQKEKCDKPLSITHSALLSVRDLFPVNRFYGKISPIVMIHQLYDLIPSRTTVDREIKTLQNAGKICIFKLGVELLARAVILTDDLMETAKKCYPNNPLVEKFINFIVPLGIVEVEKIYLEKSFTQKEISELMHCGYLVFSTDSRSYLLSFPNAGHFMKAFTRGRKAILQIVKKSKHGEILQIELEERKLEKSVVLGATYQVHDVVGADLVRSIMSTSGRLLRLET